MDKNENNFGEFRVGSEFKRVEIPLETQADPAVAFVSVIDGLLLFEGDIAVYTPSVDLSVVIEGAGVSGASFRWPSRTIPFTIESGDSAAIHQAIDHWTANTVIRFVNRTTQNDFVTFRISSGADSQVGRRGNRQFINLPSAPKVGTIIHEIGHAVGLWHEHSREDRDKHIEVLKKNIKPGAELNFMQHIADGDDLGAYDFGSIMHYPPDAFGRNGAITLRGRNGETFGQRERLSAGDINTVRTMYP